MPRLGASSQGEAGLRVLRLVRRGDRHDPRDLTVSIRFEGTFAAAFLGGRADGVVPGETLKTFVYETARSHGDGEIEPFALALCARVLDAHRNITRVRVDVSEQPWTRLDVGGKAQGRSFVAGGPERRTVSVTSNGTRTAVVSGIASLILMRTSGFLERVDGARADDGLEDAVQPLLVGELDATWTYGSPDIAFGVFRQGVRAALADTFALHAARSLHYSLYAMADVILATYEDILDVTLSMHERPYRSVDPLRDAAADPEDVFVSAEPRAGIVQITVERDRPGA
jgi:urate oxidase